MFQVGVAKRERVGEGVGGDRGDREHGHRRGWGGGIEGKFNGNACIGQLLAKLHILFLGSVYLKIVISFLWP